MCQQVALETQQFGFPVMYGPFVHETNGLVDDLQFQVALERERGNAWALYGLEEAAKAKGDSAAAKKAEDEFKRIWRGESGFLTLERL